MQLANIRRGPRPRRYGNTQPDCIAWACPDCGALVEFFTGRPIHDRWHANLAGRLTTERTA